MNKVLIQEGKTWSVWLYRRESDGWKKRNSSPSSSSKTNETTTVAPRKDCIIFPSLRQRFSLKSASDQGTVIRRDEKIILVSKRRARALLLRFQSFEECLAFSDDFVRLNQKLPLLPSVRNEKKNENNQSLDTSQQQCGMKRLSIPGDKSHRKIVSWIVKMLHDKYFLNYVAKIENYITETEDGIQMLRGLDRSEMYQVCRSQSQQTSKKILNTCSEKY